MTTDYTAGPMSGKPKLNFPMFDEVARAWERKGNKVINPADHDREVGRHNGVVAEHCDGFLDGDVKRYHAALGSDMASLLGWDLVAIIKDCDGIIMLPGWENSTGAGHEKYVAEAVGKTVQYAYRTVQGHWLFLDFDLYARERMHSIKVEELEALHHRFKTFDDMGRTYPDGTPAVTVQDHAFLDLAELQAQRIAAGLDPVDGLPATTDEQLARATFRDLVQAQRIEPGVWQVVGGKRPAEVIGLVGYAQVGKDTLASQLVEHHGFTRIAFADVLRECLYALNPIVGPWMREPTAARLQDFVNRVGWDRAKTEYPEVRALLQRLGTEMGRNILGNDIWVETALKKVQPGGKYVITDVRFPNEFAAIEKLGGKTVRIVREGYGPVNDHWSEKALDSYAADVTVWNSGTPADLLSYAVASLRLEVPA